MLSYLKEVMTEYDPVFCLYNRGENMQNGIVFARIIIMV